MIQWYTGMFMNNQHHHIVVWKLSISKKLLPIFGARISFIRYPMNIQRQWDQQLKFSSRMVSD